MQKRIIFRFSGIQAIRITCERCGCEVRTPTMGRDAVRPNVMCPGCSNDLYERPYKTDAPNYPVYLLDRVPAYVRRGDLDNVVLEVDRDGENAADESSI